MKRLSERPLAFAVATFVLGALIENAAHAGVLVNDVFPIEPFQVFVDCDGDGIPEDLVDLFGGLHVLITETVDRRGNVHLTEHFQPHGVFGIGLLTGDIYNAVGLTRGTAHLDPVDPGFFIATSVNNFHQVARGGGLNFNVRNRMHVVIIDGETIVFFDTEEVTCR